MAEPELPIAFSPATIPALLDGRKTQTRRIARPPDKAVFLPDDHWRIDPDEPGTAYLDDGSGRLRISCPYGAPGRRLWVREDHYRFGHWEPVVGSRTTAGRQKWGFVADSTEARFDPPEAFRRGRHHKDPATPAWHKRLGRFMPRRFARIILEVTEVRFEPLNVITEDDAIAEGVEYTGLYPAAVAAGFLPRPADIARKEFKKLWESIHGPGSWEANPWVWAVTFKRIQP